MSQLKAEIVAVGTELLLGQIANTNAQWLSEQIANYGINVFYHGVVGDNLERVKSSFELASARSDIIFVTGGLGPTDDDLTREAFQALTNKILKEDQSSINKITNYFEKNSRQMTPNNRKQALVFDDAIVLPNSAGMAPGMIVDHNNAIWVFMPGVPNEMKAITSEHVIPYLKKTLQLNTVIQSRMLRFIGIGESQLEHELKSLIDAQENPTIAPLAFDGEVAIRVTAKAETNQKADELINNTTNKIFELVGSHFYGYDQETIEKKVYELLKNNNLTIATAESLTGGRFADSIVSISGASDVFMGGVVAYSAKTKETMLGVSLDTLSTYGTVSSNCAEEMAQNVKRKLDADIGISFTGIAGPDSVEGKPSGTVFIGIYGPSNQSLVKEFHFQGNRDGIRIRSVKKGFELLRNHLIQL
ncbi:competence/damage-inducible protein A [Aquibacillus halophilus]|uniref:Putative competence-damage inducible protein n=1 Tax=Aquibacillus halophilus TaxID=930132 RepID=A0A6A8DAB8_9BACI|nr:competence/damage-inducible protein A [Aquibacillus halophilus]MRH42645.1 competence/damage-inducible protein A [Aquibacillus halophilus]